MMDCLVFGSCVSVWMFLNMVDIFGCVVVERGFRVLTVGDWDERGRADVEPVGPALHIFFFIHHLHNFNSYDFVVLQKSQKCSQVMILQFMNLNFPYLTI